MSPLSSVSTAASHLTSILESGTDRGRMNSVSDRSRQNSHIRARTHSRDRGAWGDARAGTWAEANKKRMEFADIPVIQLKR